MVIIILIYWYTTQTHIFFKNKFYLFGPIIVALILGELGGVTFFSPTVCKLEGGDPDKGAAGDVAVFISSRSTDAEAEPSGEPSRTSWKYRIVYKNYRLLDL